MTDQVSRRVWRLTIGLLIGVSAITISLAFIIAASGQPSTRSMLWAGFDDQPRARSIVDQPRFKREGR